MVSWMGSLLSSRVAGPSDTVSQVSPASSLRTTSVAVWANSTLLDGVNSRSAGSVRLVGSQSGGLVEACGSARPAVTSDGSTSDSTASADSNVISRRCTTPRSFLPDPGFAGLERAQRSAERTRAAVCILHIRYGNERCMVGTTDV